ncbi:hypothetical protein [Providencia phage PSTRCR_117lys]|nr:hypothetical protein [Providencia phage PSTRCR_117lys]
MILNYRTGSHWTPVHSVVVKLNYLRMVMGCMQDVHRKNVSFSQSRLHTRQNARQSEPGMYATTNKGLSG